MLMGRVFAPAEESTWASYMKARKLSAMIRLKTVWVAKLSTIGRRMRRIFKTVVSGTGLNLTFICWIVWIQLVVSSTVFVRKTYSLTSLSPDSALIRKHP